MKKYLFLANFIAFSLLVSCEKNLPEETSDHIMSTSKSVRELRLNKKNQETEFSKILSKALATDKELRAFLKEQALKKFDNDYDVLYHMVMNQVVSNGETFRDKLIKVSDEKSLSAIEDNLPLLNIYVPSLPNGWSAAKWDVATEVPYVCPADAVTDTVTYYLGTGEVRTSSRKAFPGFPVVAVKTNERLVVQGTDNVRIASRNTKSFTTSKYTYKFIDESFQGDSIQGSDEIASNQIALGPEPLLTLPWPVGYWTAYGYNQPQMIYLDLIKAQVEGKTIWQRDKLYYNITTATPNGQLNTNYQETLTYMEFENGEAGYDLIADQNGDDPLAANSTASWSEGFFEFGINLLINSQSGFGADVNKIISVAPQDLFDVTFVKSGNFYYLDQVTSKAYKPNLRLLNWDLKNLSYGWKVRFQEIDPSETITTQWVVNSQFANNFNLNIGIGKIGLGFGNSETSSSQQTHTYVRNVASDDLGEGTMLFSDPITVQAYDNAGVPPGSEMAFIGYSTGTLKFSIIPKLANW